MDTVEEIKTAIEQLDLDERAQLARWLHGWEDDDWDKQIAADAKTGKLDHLIRKAKADANHAEYDRLMKSQG